MVLYITLVPELRAYFHVCVADNGQRVGLVATPGGAWP